jgi:predicted nucleic acid-binding protein
MEILIPAEVETEVLRKRHFGSLATQWPRMRASQQVRILELLDLSGAQAQVVAHVARIRGTAANLALSQPKDLGEAVVLGHAVHLAAQGHEVYVVIDDQGGQQLAAAENIPVLTVEDILIAAYDLDLVDASKLRATYEAIIPFGAGPPTWNASSLKRTYDGRKSSRRR